MTIAHSSTINFGPFSLSIAERQLLENGRPLPVGSRALEILIALLERPGDLVGRDELVARVWPDTVVVETSLRVHVMALRKALRDGVDGARYIANVPGRGYSFVGRIGRAEPALAAASAHGSRSHNLPVRLARMIGRGRMAEELALRIETERLVTLVGPGGIGKTTLALAIAEEIVKAQTHELRFVDLVALSDPKLLVVTLAAVLGVSLDTEASLASLAEALEKRHVVLLLDNCEHLVDGVARAGIDLLRRARGLRILATSREPMGVAGETVVRLGALEAPPDASALSAADALRYPAVQLLVDRISAAHAGYRLADAEASAAAQLVRHLDGIPLAIELAAVRVGFFGLRGLLDRLRASIGVLSGGHRTVASRHQTMTALLDWSYDLLDDESRRVLRRLSVFAGTFGLDAALAVSADDGSRGDAALGQLVQLEAKSLLMVLRSGESTRYRLLETTRTYLLAKARQHGDHRITWQRYGQFLLDQLERASDAWEALTRAQWMASFGALGDDLRVVLDWSFAPEGDPILGARLIHAAVPLVHRLSLLDEYRVRVELALERLSGLPAREPMLELYLRTALGGLVGNSQGPHALGATSHYDRENGFSGQAGADVYRAEALYGLWAGQFGGGQYLQALEYADALAAHCESTGDADTARVARRSLAQTWHHLGEHERARSLAMSVLEDPVRMMRLGGSALVQVDRRVSMRIVLSRVAWLQGFPDRAVAIVEECLSFAEGDLGYAKCQALALAAIPIALWRGEEARAASLVSQLRACAEQHSLGAWLGWTRTFEELLAGSDLYAIAPSDCMQWDMVGTLLRDRAPPIALARAVERRNPWCAPEILRAHGEAVGRRGAPESSQEQHDLLATALQLARQQGALSWELRIATSLLLSSKKGAPELEARRCLAEVVARFAEGHGTRDLRVARALLGDADDSPHPSSKARADRRSTVSKPSENRS